MITAAQPGREEFERNLLTENSARQQQLQRIESNTIVLQTGGGGHRIVQTTAFRYRILLNLGEFNVIYSRLLVRRLQSKPRTRLYRRWDIAQ